MAKIFHWKEPMPMSIKAWFITATFLSYTSSVPLGDDAGVDATVVILLIDGTLAVGLCINGFGLLVQSHVLLGWLNRCRIPPAEGFRL